MNNCVHICACIYIAHQDSSITILALKKQKKKQLNPALTGLRVSAGLRWSLKLKSEQNPSRTSQLESKWKTRQY